VTAAPRERTFATSHGGAVVLLDQVPQPAFLLALTHGAGGGVDAPDLLATRDAALALGGAVARVLQPYRVRGARAPGSVSRQDAAWTEVIAALAGGSGGSPPGPAPRRPAGAIPLIQGGRSNGARLACRTALQVGARAVIALAFPLHPPGHPERSRRGELRAAGVEVLAVSGRRDPFGIPDSADAGQVVVLDGEGHGLSGNPAAVAAAVSAWLHERVLKPA
jgi:predicted alpha/beta-hydrolase family hydrolase